MSDPFRLVDVDANEAAIGSVLIRKGRSESAIGPAGPWCAQEEECLQGVIQRH